MLRNSVQSCRLRVIGALLALAFSGPTLADEWLVYTGGGLEPIDGGWQERHGQVLFHRVGGTLVSVPYSEVDLATSAFVTWQLSGRTEVPPRGPVPESAPSGYDGRKTPCVKAEVVTLMGSETLQVSAGGEVETIHAACLDAPETAHQFAELGWFGRAALRAAKINVRRGDEVCLTESSPPHRDKLGHRVVFVTLPDGRDYTAGVIAGGLGLVRLSSCDRAARYRALEDRAISEERGLWGSWGESAAFAAANNTIAIGVGGKGAAPPRRIGGG